MKKITYKILMTLLLLSVATWFGCEDELDGGTFAAYEEQPVGIWLENNPDYSLWSALLKRTNLYNALNVKTKFTCFVVDNETFQKWMDEKGYKTVEDIDLEYATYLMRYHIVPGADYAHSAFTGMIPDTTASGDYLLVKYGDAGINSIYVNEYALIVKRDIQVINGYLHKIDKVLDPVVRTIWDVVSENPNYSIFKEAVELCELDEWLSTRRKTLGGGGDGEVDEEIEVVTVEDYKTVFVVSNDVFAEAGINSIEDLKERFPSGDTISAERSPFKMYVGYHILNSNSDFANLSTFQKDIAVKKKNSETAAINELISIEDYDKRLVLNRNTDSISFVADAFDQQANNGYVHEVNHWMPIQKPTPAHFEWKLYEVEDMKRLPEWGKKEGTQRYKLDTENPVDVWFETVPETDDAVVYQPRENMHPPEFGYFLMKLGYVGWAEVRTPVIVAGKYKLTLVGFDWGIRGTCQMYIDDQKQGDPLSFSKGSGKRKDVGEKIFFENGRHIIKFQAVKPGDMEVERIIFEPIND